MRRTHIALAAAAVLVGASWLASYVVDRRAHSTDLGRAWERLSHRAIRARLSGFPHRPLPPSSAGRAARTAVIQLRQTAARALAHPQNDSAHARGVALLLAGQAADAAEAFTACTTSTPFASRCWSDRAAAELEQAVAHDEPRRLALAFAAADRAVQLAPRLPEALFNRAMALDAMHLDAPAKLAWRRYLFADGQSAWADEARARLAALRRQTRTRQWNKARQQLVDASQRNDGATVRRIVAEYRQDARTYAELPFLTDWANAEKSGDAAAAARHLVLARAIGDALLSINGERLLADAVAAIDRSSGATRATLVDAQLTYSKARDFNTDRNVSAAAPLFDKSARLFRAAHSPMFRMAEYFRANCETDTGNVEGALASIQAQLTGAPASYRALRGQLLWQRGTASIRLGRVYDALQAYRDALSLFADAREENNTIYMHIAMIAMYAALGRDGDAWRERVRAFPAISHVGHPRLLQTALDATARAEAAAGRWESACAFYGLSLDPALEPPNPSLRVDASIWRSLAAHRLRWSDVANQELERARRTVKALEDASMRGTSEVRLMLTEALSVGESDPRAAIELLSRAVTEAKRYNDLFDLPEIYLERGRMWRRVGDAEKAREDFESALSMSDARGQTAPDIEIRNSYFSAAEAAAEQLVDLIDRSRDADALLLAVDRNRARSFRTPAGTEVAALRNGVPPGTVILHFTSLPDRLLIIATTEHGGPPEIARVTIARDVLKKQIARLTADIVETRDDDARSEARSLYALLLGSMQPSVAHANLLVIVPDDVIAAVPFAALVRPDGRYLIETTAIAYAPNATFFTAAMRDAPPPHPSRVLTVGDPRFDTRLWPNLDPLPECALQAREVGRIYNERVELIGGDATLPRVIAGLKSSPVADFACHAVVDARDPSRSLLLLTPTDTEGGSLYLRDVSRLSLQLRMVVLAACRTSAPAERSPVAMRSFTLAFLAAGAKNAVGALWDVDDHPARRVSTMLHRHLCDGVRAADALRLAQVTMLRSTSPELRPLRSWSGFQLFGAGN